MHISHNFLVGLQLFASLFMLAMFVIAIILKYRRALPRLRAYALIMSGMILSAAVQLPGRSLNGANGIIVILNLVVIVAGLAVFFLLLWQAESKSTRPEKREAE